MGGGGPHRGGDRRENRTRPAHRRGCEGGCFDREREDQELPCSAADLVQVRVLGLTAPSCSDTHRGTSRSTRSGRRGLRRARSSASRVATLGGYRLSLPSDSCESDAAPSTAIACPLIWAASALTRKATAAAISAGSTSLPVGTARSPRSPTPSGIPTTCPVATRPGRIALTVIPYAAFSLASVRTIPSCPAFDAAYATCPGSPPNAAMLEITTTRP